MCNQLCSFIWCKWVLIKCNIMAWRGNLDRLLTRVNLRRRNVDIPSDLCPLCGDYEETVDHLFTACTVALRVWSVFSDWCNIPPFFFFEFKDILESHKLIKRGKMAEKIIYGLGIWKGRNDTVFNQRKCSASDIIGELKSRGYEWVKNRSPCKFIIWEDWCKYPLYML
ncbi:putative reverse transcriptase zinc-binding domain-containing protein [Helianthus debilis subsp. tardiflorus]